MTDNKDRGSDPNVALPTAQELRMALLEKEMEKASVAQRVREVEEKKLAEFSASFLHDDVSEDERTMIRRLVSNAVKDGKFEAMVYSFPSSLCTDSGRAINNGDDRWPETLQGKARILYDRYQSMAKPAGYKLKAMIVNFPGGVPGDVGFFLNWAPEHI